MTQQPLFEVQRLKPSTGLTIQDRFDAFHHANPWVLTALESLVQDQLAHGHHRVGIKNLVEVVRWSYSRATTTRGSSFRINNDFTSRYARLLITRHPQWADVFETRELRAA